MNKVFISVCFEKFKKTQFSTISEAIQFVKANNLPNTRLRLKTVNTIEEWDNF